MHTLDARLYHDVNRLAVHTGSLHGIARAYFTWLGLAALGACLVVAWWRGRFRPDAPTAVAGAAWAGLGAVAAALLAQPVVHAVGRVRPYEREPGALVLVGHGHSFGFPSTHAVVAGAVMTALWWCGRWAESEAAMATIVGGLLALAAVYVGVSYPGDVVAGLLFGAAAAAVLRPPGMRLLSWLAVKLERSPLHLVVAAHRA